jgi:hypothetical protein
MKIYRTAIVFVLGLSLAAVGQTAKARKPLSAKKFDAAAESALAAMKKTAAELKVTGVAVVCYAQGDTVQSWNSKMAVVGRSKDEPSATAKGVNLIAIAYSKAAEMADTRKDSGTDGRPPMTGEFGYHGGLILHTASGYFMVVFSGGKSEDDVAISRVGLERLKSTF